MALDKKFFISVFVSAFLAGTGGVSAFYVGREENREKVFAAIESNKKDLEAKFATKEEINFIRESLSDLRSGVNLANDRLYEIQQNQILVKVANDRLVKIQKRLSVANENVADLKEQVKSQKVLVQKVLDKKKK